MVWVVTVFYRTVVKNLSEFLIYLRTKQRSRSAKIDSSVVLQENLREIR